MGTIDADMLRKSLGSWPRRAESLAVLLGVAGVPSSALEASVRQQDGVITCDRMMLEGLDALTALAILTALGFDLTGSLVLRAAGLASGLPFIGGWDASGQQLVGKLYINASNAAKTRREQLARALDLPEAAGAPHVVGFNVREQLGEGLLVETKVYEQWADLKPPKARGLDVPAFIETLAEDSTLAGVVRSRVVEDDGLRTKAWFVAPRSENAHRFLGRLPDWDDEQCKEVLPFDPGSIRSIGAPPNASSWTVYFKPRTPEGPGQASLWALEPVQCMQTQDGELGLYVEPSSAAQAYCRTDHHALSYRVREGQPSSTHIESLMKWAEEVVRDCEKSGAEPEPETFTHPPEPWHVVSR